MPNDTISDATVDSFLALKDKGKQMEVLGKLSDPAKRALLSAIQSRSSETRQVTAGLPQPKAELPPGLRKTERALQFGPGGPQFVDVPAGEKEKFEAAGRKGLETGGAIGATGLMLAEGAANPAALARTAAGGAAGGYALKKGAELIGLPPWAQTSAGVIGGVLGGGIGAGMTSESWAEALTSDQPISKTFLKAIARGIPGVRGAIAKREAAAAGEEAAAAEQQQMERLTKAGRRLFREHEAEERAGQRALKSPSVASKKPYGPVEPEELAAARTKKPTAPSAEKSRIVTPESEAPHVPVTYQSYPREQLYEMAKKGDIQAGLELVRNPKGFPLPPNFKFLIEESAKRIPWRPPQT